MKILNSAYIAVDGNCGKSLPIVWGWKNSALCLRVVVDGYVSGLCVKIGNPRTKAYASTVEGVYHPKEDYWHVFAPPSAFPYAGETAYKIFAKDAKGARVVLGEGKLRIKRGMLEDLADDVGDGKDNAYILVNGNWWRIEVEEDETGTPMFVTKGVTRDYVPETASGKSYAYNNRTGLYHEVTVAMDETQTPMLVLDEKGYENVGSSTFAYEEATGFYRKIECEPDETDTLMLQTGEIEP